MFENLQDILPRATPMLAAKADLGKIRYPVLGSSKIDGIRCLQNQGMAISRSGIPLPNRALQCWSHQYQSILDGLDGELVVGWPTAPDCYRKTVSGIMTETGTPNFIYHVFDRWNSTLPYTRRLDSIRKIALPQLVVLPQQPIASPRQLQLFELVMLNLGYEGVILRAPDAPYKFGKSTQDEGYLLKIKSFEDAEATIVGYTEEMHNGNEAIISATGRIKRSSHQANKTGKGTLASWVAVGLTAFQNVTFLVGSGFSAKERQLFWAIREQCLGKIVKFKYFLKGSYLRPRHAIFLGFRDLVDLS